MWKKFIRPVIGLVVLACLGAAAWILLRGRMIETRYAENKAAGESLANEGSYAEAAAHLETSLEAARSLGPEDQRVDEVLTELAEVYVAQGKYVDTQHVTFESLTRTIDKYGPEHPKTGEVFNRLGRAYELQRVFEPAEGMYNQAIAIWEKTDGDVYLEDTAFAYRGLAHVLGSLNRGDEASKAYAKSVDLEEQRLGPDSPELAPLLREYAGLLATLGQDAESEKLAARADVLLPKTPTPTITATPTLTPTHTEPPTATPQPTDTPVPVAATPAVPKPPTHAGAATAAPHTAVPEGAGS